MELCNFGAKVIYPPTIYPVRVKGIPIYVKNTFHPEAPGSIIHKGPIDDKRAIKGISSIKNTSLVTVSGPSMVGVIGVNRRIFSTLADNGVSVFLVAQTSSEASTSLCVTDDDGEKARRVLDAEFAKEIANNITVAILTFKFFILFFKFYKLSLFCVIHSIISCFSAFVNVASL